MYRGGGFVSFLLLRRRARVLFVAGDVERGHVFRRRNFQ